MLTRWDEWFSSENLSKDERIIAAPASRSADLAASEFSSRGKQHILDLACGIGRDTFSLENRGLSLVGADASVNGIRVAQNVKNERSARVSFTVADARQLPFKNSCFEGVYCFGLLHEFTGAQKQRDVRLVIAEVRRVLHDDGLFIVTVIAGDPEAGLPKVQLFSRTMFEEAMSGWHALEITSFDDTGCTNQPDYHVWYGVFEKP